MDIIVYILIYLAGGFSGYFASYFKQKGINKALKEDNRELENQKKEIENYWAVEIEELKKSHNLDIEKRKYQYEDRRKVYSKFCSELDAYQSQGQTVLKEKSAPMIKKFFAAIESSKNEEEVKFSFSEYFEDMLLLCNDISASFVEIKNQTNHLRLVTSAETDALLDALIENMKSITDSSNEFIKYLATPDGMLDKEGQASLTSSLVVLGDENTAIRSALIKQMKAELNSI